MTQSPKLLLVVAALAAGCAPVGTKDGPGAAAFDPQRDYHSYANTRDFQTRHLVLDLSVDFTRRVIDGLVELQLERRTDAAELVLDTRDLDVTAVQIASGQGAWQATTFSTGARDPILGSPLRIALPPPADRVRIRYATRPEASGLQWVTPAQTAGKTHSFLYTQSQAIHARSWIPLQDTPAVRSTYDARVRTPKTLRAVMSAVNSPDTERDGDYTFRMPQPIPAYLIALGVGDIDYRRIGPRTGVYGERSIVGAAAAEFRDTEKMIDVGERLMGPYRWEVYDMLVLPPSFPYGGMENPRLTFLTPTSIVGDRSGVSLIAHELAHSWSGNLVTNATWRDFWLNEGTTTYLTYRIMDEIYGQPRGDMERVLGQQELVADFALVKREHEKALAYDVRGVDPDEVFSQVPYERGALFLTWLESRFGRERFDAFLRSWFDAHAFQSRTTEDFIAYAEAHLLAQQPGLVTRAQLEAWIFAPAVPADAVYAQSDAFAEVDAQRSAWLDGRAPLRALKTRAWTRHEWQHFLDNLPTLTAAQAAQLDTRFKLSAQPNAAIRTAWFKVAIRANHVPAFGPIEKFLMSMGRMRYLNPIYRELAKSEAGLALARRVFARARPTYHPIAQAGVERILSEAAPAPR